MRSPHQSSAAWFTGLASAGRGAGDLVTVGRGGRGVRGAGLCNRTSGVRETGGCVGRRSAPVRGVGGGSSPGLLEQLRRPRGRTLGQDIPLGDVEDEAV